MPATLHSNAKDYSFLGKFFLNRRLACGTGRGFKSGWPRRKPLTIKLHPSYNCGEVTVGKLARLCNGSAVAMCGDTSVLATAVSEFRNYDENFLPLTVDFRQKASAAGRIPTNFLRREVSQSNNEILTSRKIDRSIRPLFPKEFGFETQIVCDLHSFDRHNLPDVLAINAASVALSVSDIPWSGPVGAVRLGWIDGKPVVNPTRDQLYHSDLDVIVAGGGNGHIVMIDGSAKEIRRSPLNDALNMGVQATKVISDRISAAICNIQPHKYRLNTMPDFDRAVKFAKSMYKDSLDAILLDDTHDKFSRDNAISSLRALVVPEISANFDQLSRSQHIRAFDEAVKSHLCQNILTKHRRPDGRLLTALRKINCSVDQYPSLHGSSLFQRGQTQVMASVTLDSKETMARTDPVTEILVGRSERDFMLHYEFPQYSTGSIGKVGGVNRREIGHGALAEKALRSVIPEDFPHTIRVSAEVLESNGSSSMATVCAGSLALMDAGVPITTPVAGVAMGLVSADTESKGVILTDILGLEDYAGEMDFKIAGTKNGLTAFQADVKSGGIKLSTCYQALKHAGIALDQILAIMSKTISEPRTDRKDNWPVTGRVVVPATRRSRVIGSGGMNIKHIQRVTGVTITSFTETEMNIHAPNQAALDEATRLLQELLDQQRPPELEYGNVYCGKLVELQKQGALISIHPASAPVFVKNSQLDMKTIHHSEASGLVVGEDVYIKYFGTDPHSGEDRWSRRALLSAGGFSKRLLPKEEQPHYMMPTENSD